MDLRISNTETFFINTTILKIILNKGKVTLVNTFSASKKTYRAIERVIDRYLVKDFQGANPHIASAYETKQQPPQYMHWRH